MYLHARYFDPQLGTFLSPDPIGVEGGINEYGYGFGNPVNGTDRTGLAMGWTCMAKPPSSQGCGTNPSCYQPNPQTECWYGESVTVTASAPRVPVADPGPNFGIPQGSPFPVGGQQYGTGDRGANNVLTRNAGFLTDFLLGTGRTDREYTEDDPQTRDMIESPGADHLRGSFLDGGCQNMPEIGYGTPRAAYETIVRQNLLNTAAQVGGFVGSVTNNGNGTATYQIDNKAGRNSFVLHLPWVNNVEADPSGAPTPMRTIYQQFKWTEPASMAGCR